MITADGLLVLGVVLAMIGFYGWIVSQARWSSCWRCGGPIGWMQAVCDRCRREAGLE